VLTISSFVEFVECSFWSCVLCVSCMFDWWKQ